MPDRHGFDARSFFAYVLPDARPFHVVDLPEEAARVLLDENARVFAKVTIYSGDRRDPGEADREGKVAEEIKVTYALERVE